MSVKQDKEPIVDIKSTQSRLFARQPLSPLARVAFWALLMGTILGIILVVILTISNGSPSRDSVIAAVCWLVALILMATGMRWLQLLSTLLSGYLLYLIFTQPYVIESLQNPKMMQGGGYGHFVGDVVTCGFILIAFGASVAATVQNFRRGSREAPRWLPTALGIVVGMVIGALLIGAIAQPPSATGTTYTNGVPTVHMGAGNFIQSSVTIPKGSRLLLVDDVSSLHILANGTWQNGTPRPEREPGAPTVSNVQVNGNSVEIGPFNIAGTYQIYCEVHQGMNLAIIVQ